MHFVGENGTVQVGNNHVASDPAELVAKPVKNPKMQLERSNDHIGNWLQCIVERRDPIASAEIGHRSATVCHLANIARWVGAVSLAWTTDGKTDSFNIPWDLVLSKVRDTGAIIMFAIGVKNGAEVTDTRIVEQLRARAKQAQEAGVTLGIYPHLGFRVSRFEHATRVAKAVDHPALGVCFVLSHYMKQSDEKDLPARLRAAKGRIVAAVINGSATGNTKAMGWDRLIQHIDQGEFDLPGLLELLCGELRFKGPVFVQCVNFNIPAPTRRTLEASYTKWQVLKRHCVKQSK